MGYRNKQICRLCLEITPACECETIDEVKMEILEVLRINIDFYISDYAFSCNSCLEKLQDCFDFKSRCISTLMETDSNRDIKKDSQRGIIINENICLGNSPLCWLCMSFIEDETLSYSTVWKDEVFLKDMFKNCLPEVNLNTVHEPLICKQCVSSMKRYYKFIKTCQNVEQSIEHYCQKAGLVTGRKVGLKDVLKFNKNCDNLENLKIINVDVENVDGNAVKCLTLEEIAGIKCEEIDIKYEVSNGVERSGTGQSGDYDGVGKKGSPKRKRKVKKCESKVEVRDIINKPFCRLCLTVIPDGNCGAIDDIKKEILEVLLINIDFNMSDEVLACERCMDKLQDCFDFKSTCFYVNDYISPFVKAEVTVDIKKVFQKVMSKENMNLENVQICRLCMSPIEDESFNYATDSKDGVFLNEIIRNCLPEVDLNIVHEPLICNQCLSNVKKYNEFVKTCHKVEQKIKIYYQVMGRLTNLEDMFKFKGCDLLRTSVKMINDPNVKNGDATAMEYLQNEVAEIIESKVVDIKNELGKGIKMDESDQSGDCKSSGRSGSSKTKKKVTKSTLEGKRHFCPMCPYSSQRSGDVKRHISYHSDNKSYRCTLCSFATNARLSLEAHASCHRGVSKAFGCRECPYETDIMRSLVQHNIKHKDESEVEMYRCPICPFKTKYKSGLVDHRRLQHGKNVKIYKCQECLFSTKYVANFVSHQAMHKKLDEILTHKCDKCKYETRNKQNLKTHMQRHEDPGVVNRYKCKKCPYRARWQTQIKKHMLIHTEEHPYSCDQCSYSTNNAKYLLKHKLVHLKPSEREMHKCKLCSYQAFAPGSLKDHMIKIHTDPSEVPIFKCTHCPYETNLLKSLTGHVRRQHKKDRPDFKCALCPYVTKVKSYLQRHLFVHQEASFQCNQCNYRTKHLYYLRIHERERHDFSKELAYNCDHCTYRTSNKTKMNRHQVVHIELDEALVYHCMTCDFKTKHKSNLRRHLRTCSKKNDEKKKKKRTF